MTPKLRQLLLQYALAFLGAGAVAVTIFIGGIDRENRVPEPITVGGETIEFTWTDDNANEDLIIFTDQRDYNNGLSGATVYVAVANRSGEAQNIELMGYFKDQKRFIRDVSVLTDVTYEVPVYESKCTSVVQRSATTTAETTVESCEQVQTGVTTEQRLDWVPLPQTKRDLAEIVKESDMLSSRSLTRKAVENFVAENKTVAFPVPRNGVIYYKLEVKYPVNDTGNFYLEAVGSAGAYGHLDPWFDANWDYRVKITVDNTRVAGSANHTNFPVYIDLSDLPADFHTNVKSDGCDIRVVEADETTETPFELVSYDSTTDTGELHVKVDSLSYNTDTDLWIYYGNSSASCYAVSDTYGRNNVWSDYAAVFHLETGALTTDSTGNTAFTNAGSTGNTTGIIGDGALFNNVNKYLYRNSAAEDFGSNADLTITSYIKVTTNNDFANIFAKTGGTPGGGGGESYMFVVMADRKVQGNRGGAWVGRSASAITASAWNHVAMKIASSRCYYYINGSLDANDFACSYTDRPGNNISLGIWVPTAYNLIGDQDETRLRSGAMNDGWIATEYNNLSSPGTFYSVGAQETNGGGGGGGPRRIIITS